MAVISDPLDTRATQAGAWLNKDFLSVEKPRTIAVQFPEATNSWKLTRASETNDWQLAGAKAGEKLDSTKISSVTSPFSSASFNDVAAARHRQPPASNTVLTVETFDGFTTSLKHRPKKDDNYPVTFLRHGQPARRPHAGQGRKACGHCQGRVELRFAASIARQVGAPSSSCSPDRRQWNKN